MELVELAEPLEPPPLAVEALRFAALLLLMLQATPAPPTSVEHWDVTDSGELGMGGSDAEDVFGIN